MKSALIVLICKHIQFVAKSHLLNVLACTDLILRLHCCALDDPGHGVPGDVLRLQLRVRLDLLHDVTCTLWRVTHHDLQQPLLLPHHQCFKKVHPKVRNNGAGPY